MADNTKNVQNMAQ